MARPAKFDRRGAVEFVMNELWRNGFGACSVKSISEKLGITRSSFYNAFGSRENLFLEALDLYFSKSPDKALADISEDTNVLQALTRFFREVCRARAADPDARGCMAVNCVAELVGADETLGPVLEEAVINSLERFENLLRQARKAGEIETDTDLKGKALALQNLLIGLNVMAKVVRSENDLWTAAKQTLEGLELFRE